MEGGETPATPVRGRGKSRGGLGKYLRARGRGRGRGRGAVWNERLVLEDEQQAELDEEQAKELEVKYSRRQLGSNADRYKESEPELDSEGEEIKEPEVDLSQFLARQRLSPDPTAEQVHPDEDDDVDTTLAHQAIRSSISANNMKGKLQKIEWDANLEALSREKDAADATRELKDRFRTKATSDRFKTISTRDIQRQNQRGKSDVVAPALPTDGPAKSEKEDMEGFLDDLLE